MLDLSIIIVSYNVSELLRDCLNSIAVSVSQIKLPIQYEVIVVDNASVDSTVKTIKKDCPWVHLIVSEKNLGFSKANNLGIQEAQGEHILLLNPDTIVHPGTLETILQHHRDNPAIGAISCRVELPDGTLDWASHRGTPTPWAALTYFSGLSRLLPTFPLFTRYHLSHLPFDQIHEVDSICGTFMMVKRKAGDKIGWLDEDYFWMGEDVDFCHRLKLNGWTIVYYPHAKITHYKGASSGLKRKSQNVTKATLETKLRSTHNFYAAMRIFYNKHLQERYPGWVNWLVMGGIGLKERWDFWRLKFRSSG